VGNTIKKKRKGIFHHQTEVKGKVEELLHFVCNKVFLFRLFCFEMLFML